MSFSMFNFNDLPSEVFDVIGVAGFGLYVLNYFLLTLGRIDPNNAGYFVINLLAATLVMIGLSVAFNLAAALIQGFWIVMSVIAIAIRIRRRKRSPVPTATLIEFPVAPPSDAPRPHDQHSPDVFLETDYRGRGYERRNPHRAAG